jgi:hypothetical protein
MMVHSGVFATTPLANGGWLCEGWSSNPLSYFYYFEAFVARFRPFVLNEPLESLKLQESSFLTNKL